MSRRELRSILEFLPSAGWIGLMVFPFIFQYSLFDPISRYYQLNVILGVAVAFFLADFVCWRRGILRGSIEITAARRSNTRLYFIIFLLITVSVSMIHLYLMPKIPLLSLFGNDRADQSVEAMRDAAAKSLDVPFLVKYFFTWTLVVFAPIAIILAMNLRYRFLAALLLIYTSFYAVSTSAKLPILLLWFSCLIAICMSSNKWGRVALRCFIGLVTIAIAMLLYLLFVSPPSYISEPIYDRSAIVIEGADADDPRFTLTFGDISRLQKTSAEPAARRKLDYLLYRVWLTPADVASRWYQYFDYNHLPKLGVSSIYSRDRQLAPSRTIGIWAYHSRFPSLYPKYVSAYASFDADAYARGGTVAVVAATLLLIIARLFAGLVVDKHPIALMNYAVLLVGFAVLPTSSSIQAMLGAQGLALVFIPLVLIHLYKNRGASTS